jgi:hypothetical protein
MKLGVLVTKECRVEPRATLGVPKDNPELSYFSPAFRYLPDESLSNKDRRGDVSIFCSNRK